LLSQTNEKDAGGVYHFYFRRPVSWGVLSGPTAVLIDASIQEAGFCQESLWTFFLPGGGQRRDDKNWPNGYRERNFDAIVYCVEHGAFVLFAHAR